MSSNNNNNATVTNTTAPTYLELISRDEKVVQKENLKITAQEAALVVSKEVLALRSEEAVLKSELEKVKRSVPYSLSAEWNVAQKLVKVQERLVFANEIKDSRFSDATI